MTSMRTLTYLDAKSEVWQSGEALASAHELVIVARVLAVLFVTSVRAVVVAIALVVAADAVVAAVYVSAVRTLEFAVWACAAKLITSVGTVS